MVSDFAFSPVCVCVCTIMHKWFLARTKFVTTFVHHQLHLAKLKPGPSLYIKGYFFVIPFLNESKG